jgi:hypothetical protein
MRTMAKEKAKKPRRPIYDDNYYKAQAMLLDDWFIDKKKWLLNRFAETGCPLPQKPFKTYQQYMDWNEKFWKRHAEMERGPEVAEARLRLTGNKERMTSEEFYAFEDFKESFLPPIYGQVYDEILEHFNIDPKDKGFRDFLEFHFFFGQDTYPTQPFGVTWLRRKPNEPMKLYVEIYGHTKQEDFLAHWNWIEREQRHLPDFMGKSKARETFARDREIYALYREIKAANPKRANVKKSRLPADTLTLMELDGRYPGLTITNIRTIVTRARKRLGSFGDT